MTGPLPDGVYDVFVVDAVEHPGAEGEPPALELTLTIIAGDHRGEVVTISATGIGRSDIDVIGMPGELTVRDDAPSVVLDD